MVRNPERRTALIDAAIEVLARDGARGLTLRAVDVEAGVPTGTTSNYVTNRDDLLDQVVRRVHARITASPTEMTEVGVVEPTRDSAAEQLRALFGRIERERSGYLALLELRLEATRRPELRATMTEFIRANHERDADWHQRSGLPGDRTTVLMLYLAMTGLVVEHLTLPEMLDPRDPYDVVTDLVAQLMPLS